MMKIRWFRWLKWLSILFLLGVVVLNVVLYNHAYYFTHFTNKDIPRISRQAVQQQGWQERLKLAFFGVEIPKSRNKILPSAPFKTIHLIGTPQLEAWMIPTERPIRGVVLLFHGYTAHKSTQLKEAQVFRQMGYHTFLVDLRGHGGSDGLQTTIGYHEADDVRRAFEHIQRRYPDLPIVLYGSSMGAVSILKAVYDYDLAAECLVLECPFESMEAAIHRRFEQLNVPKTILSDLLLFWGGWQNDMDAFEHKSTRYAAQVKLPTLLLHGKHDQRVHQSEADAIVAQLAGPHQLVVLEAGHDHMYNSDSEGWTRAIWRFLES